MKPELPPRAVLQRHKDSVAEKGCAVCRGEAEVHHVKVGHRIGNRDDRFVVGLCPFHHRDQRFGYHGLGNVRLFKEMYGVDLEEMAISNWRASNG